MRRLDTVLYALFSRHAERPRHAIDRDRYRAVAPSVGFETYLSRIYGLSWVLGGCIGTSVLLVGGALPASAFESMGGVLSDILPQGMSPSVRRGYIVVFVALVFGLLAKRGTITTSGVYLRWRANARRVAIERSLPGAVRYLRALANGSEGRREMLRKVAERDAYGETAASFERVLETAALTGSLETGLRSVADETPSRGFLSPFLLKLREHAQGGDSLQRYLRTESRMLSHRQSHDRQRAGGYLELLAEICIALLVLPVILVIGVAVASTLTAEPSGTLSGADLTIRGLLVYGSSAFVLLVGGCGALLIAGLRPSNYTRQYERPAGFETLTTVATNPASAAFVFAFPAVIVAWALWMLGGSTITVLLSGYVAYGFPVGAVAVKREQRDDAKDREIREFVHAVAGHASLGKPFGIAVETVAREVDFGALEGDIDDLAFRLGLTTGTAGMDTKREALDRFAARVGTPLAEQTSGLVTGALDVGSDAETTFETLRMEVGALYHQRKQLRSAMIVYVVVGWAMALLAVLVIAVVNIYLGGDAQGSGVSLQLYLLAQSTMLACGWFAGAASRGRYEALLHSSALVVICYIVFAGAKIV